MTTYRSRATGLESMLDEFFGTHGLEADLLPDAPDAGFPLRPFAAAVPQDDLVATEPSTDESPADRLYRRAVEAASRGRVAEAIQRYRELLALDPGHVAARNNLSALLETTGDPAEALNQLTQALRVAPDDVNMLVSRGAIHGRLKQYADAEGDLLAGHLLFELADAHRNTFYPEERLDTVGEIACYRDLNIGRRIQPFGPRLPRKRNRRIEPGP